MRRLLPAASLFALVLLPAPPPAGGQRDPIRPLIAIEAELLERSLAAYEQARAAEREARREVDEAASRLDQRIAGGGDAGELDEALAVARQRERATAERAAALRLRIVDHRQRIALLEQAGGRLVPGPDLLTGRWRIVLEPGGLQGIMELHLDGTRVAGSYRLDGGGAGSLAGSFAGGRIRLERTDTTAGLDAILQGVYDPASRRLSGTWQPIVVSGGAPGGGTWAAVPLTEPEGGGR